MSQARDEAGNIWEVDAQGNAIRLISAAPRQPRVLQSPKTQYEAPAAQADLQRAQVQAEYAQPSAAAELEAKRSSIAKDAAEMPFVGTRAAAEARAAVANAAKAETESVKAARDLASQNSQNPETAKNVQKLQQDEVLSAIQQARQNSTGWSTGLAGQLLKNIWGSQAADLSGSLNTVGSGLTLDKMTALKQSSSTGASGLGALSEREGAMLRDSVAAIGQDQSKDQLLSNLGKVEMHYRRYRALLDGVNPDQPETAKQYGLAAPAMAAAATAAGVGGSSAGPGGGAGGGGNNPSDMGGPAALTSDGKLQSDPALKGVNAKVSNMIKAGVPAAGIRQYLNEIRPGYGSTVQGIEEAVAYARQNPKQPTNVDVEKTWVPATGVQKTMGDIGMSPLGAAVIGAGDTLTMGALDNMTGNPAMTRAVMSGVSQENPMSYMAGQIGGGALSGVGLEAGLGRLGIGAANAARAGDVAFGAGYGAGAADEPGQSRVAAALLGGVTGGVGGVAGRQAARIGGGALTGVRDNARVLLDRAGVSMTPGQILGGMTQRTEDRIAGLPFVGDQIRARRVEGMTDFGQAAFDQQARTAGQPTGQAIGPLGVENAFRNSSAAYDAALGGRNIPTDQALFGDLIPAARLGMSNPAHGQDVRSLLQTEVLPLAPNLRQSVSGQEYQNVDRALQGLEGAYNTRATGMNPEPIAAPVARSFGMMSDALDANVARNAPDVLPMYQDAKASYRQAKILQDATNRARNGSRSGTVDQFAPSQLADAAAANARSFGGTQGTTNQPFFDLTRAGQEVLPSSVPDSGTAGRSVVAGLLAAGLGGGGGAAASDEGHRAQGGASGAVIAGLLASAPYSATARNALQRALLAERPQAVQQAGELLANNSRIAGLLAAPAAVQYTGGQ